MELMTERVRYELAQGVARITLCDVSRGNSLNRVLLTELQQALIWASNDTDCRVITLWAEGSTFCKGMDFEEAFGNDARPDPAFCRQLLDMLFTIREASQPVIACVETEVVGGGVGLVAACDFVLAIDSATFMLPEVVVGMIPALITPFLLERISPARVRYLSLSTRKLSASEAQQWGLVDETTPDEIRALLNHQLRRLLRSSPQALARIKWFNDELSHNQLRRRTELALKELVSWLKEESVVEGISSFAEGFSPPWFQKYRESDKP
jgi:enoyl-CoA hydratase/carnithine racemase